MADLINQMQKIMCTSCTECEANWCDGEDKEECRWMQKIAEAGASVEAEIRAKAIDDVFDYLKTQRKGIYMRVDFDDLEIRQYKEKLKAGGNNE